MKVLGIDPGTGILGFGVVEASKTDGVKLVGGGVIKTPVNQADGDRLKVIYDELSQIITELNPEVMAVEKLFFARNVSTAMSVAQARGAVLLCGRQHGLELFEYTPLQIKQALTGYGRADKQQIQAMVRAVLGLKETPKPDDCADALAVAICHAMQGEFKMAMVSG